ncbi:MAG: hypothetical protein IPG53_04665 [Ignavibacteriales bacterium]|nr:hypothetical protein [Ignavibacteriales bacterium]
MRASVFLLLRYLKPGNKSRTYTFFSLAALTGIALGVTTLVVAFSILGGYEKVMSEKLTSFDADIHIYGYGNQDLGGVDTAKTKITVTAGDWKAGQVFNFSTGRLIWRGELILFPVY